MLLLGMTQYNFIFQTQSLQYPRVPWSLQSLLADSEMCINELFNKTSQQDIWSVCGGYTLCDMIRLDYVHHVKSQYQSNTPVNIRLAHFLTLLIIN